MRPHVAGVGSSAQYMKRFPRQRPYVLCSHLWSRLAFLLNRDTLTSLAGGIRGLKDRGNRTSRSTKVAAHCNHMMRYSTDRYVPAFSITRPVMPSVSKR